MKKKKKNLYEERLFLPSLLFKTFFFLSKINAVFLSSEMKINAKKSRVNE